jgi:hypothetical protein
LPKCHHAALISYQIVWFVLNNIKTQEYLIWNIKQKIERSTNQKINLIERSTWLKDSTDRKINRSINRSKDQLIERSADHKINRLKDQPIKIDWKIKYMNTKKTKLNKLKDQLNKRSTDRKINRSKDQLIERSTDWKINRSKDQPIKIDWKIKYINNKKKKLNKLKDQFFNVFISSCRLEIKTEEYSLISNSSLQSTCVYMKS